MTEPIIGQEAICPDGLGRVVNFGDDDAGAMWIEIDTYIRNRACEWDAKNVELIDPRNQK